tara:strand:+ start:477 stop:959 length:483 start_codon:yes stop_codon:yes gene_type:complete
MSGEHLSNRSKWQDRANIVGAKGEEKIANLLASELPDKYEIICHPDKLRIYPEQKGVVLDHLIRNRETGKVLYIEVKTGNRGGNAHERVYKFVSPGLQKRVKEMFNTTDQPFYFLFTGETFQKSKYRNEFNLLLDGFPWKVLNLDDSNIKEIANQIMEIL